MSRYIDADALIDFLDIGHLRHPDELSFSEIDVANLLLHAPTVDAVQVVRCKDCAYRDEEPCDDNLLWCNRIGNAVLPFGYCSDGIRRLDKQ